MQIIAWFKDITNNDVSIAGGKGASLGEMYRAEFPIPNGFAITAQAYSYFIEKTGLSDHIYSLLDDLDVNDTKKLQETSKKVQDLILAEQLPSQLRDAILTAYEQINTNYDSFNGISAEALQILKSGRELPYVAVRSSATAEDLPEASFAGQQETFLNIKGQNNLLKSVQKCWASLFTARAIYYRVENNFPHEKVAISVIVQKQIMSQKSGVCFTANPLTGNENEMMIEAGFGLGEAIVSGSINPDQYIVEKYPLRILSKNVHQQDWMFTLDPNLGSTARKNIPQDKRNEQKLTDHEIKNLVEIAKKIETHYDCPQDIEFAVEGMKIYIVQSRPITTLKKVMTEHNTETEKFAEEPLLKGSPASAGVASGKVKIVYKPEDIRFIDDGDILVAEMTSPDYVPAMKKASAIITDSGGTTSHAAIVSRELGIPCVVGTMHATKTLVNGQIVTVDGYSGKVYQGTIQLENKKTEARPIVSTKTKIKLILDLPDLAERHATLPVDGVGLLRLEVVIANAGIHPAKYLRDNNDHEYTDMLVREIEKVAKVFPNKPIWVRTSDFRTDEYRNLSGGQQEPFEANPMMGWHGIRRALAQPDLLRAEFKAIKKLHQNGMNHVGIMIPFVISIDEIKRAKDLLLETGLVAGSDVAFGVMIETPAAVQIIEDICKERVSFISIGSNDLTQLTLGIDRNNANLQSMFSEMHPAVLKEITSVIETCKKYKTPSSLCGQAGSDPAMARILVQAGIDSISVQPDAVGAVSEAVAAIERQKNGF